MNQDQRSKALTFSNLHKKTFVLPNAWDAGSARIFEECGFQAIGTTSAGIANSQGYQDRNIPFKEVINTLKQIINAVNVPVTVDLEDGYGKTTDDILKFVQEVVLVGAVGINLEDSTMDQSVPLYEITAQQQKIAAIKEYSIKKDIPLWINARTDLYWSQIGKSANRLEETIKRAKAYEKAGADSIFVPAMTTIEEISTLRSELTCPINILAGPETPPISKLSEIGIQRISCGSAPFRAAITTLRNIGNDILQFGTFDKMTSEILSYKKINDLF